MKTGDAASVDRGSAAVYARWFRCLGDATRLQVLNVLACAAPAEMTVGQLVDAMDVVQSTVSEHLRVLAEVGFVKVRQDGIRRFYRVNERCLEGFPSAADVVMGRCVRTSAAGDVAIDPWECAS